MSPQPIATAPIPARDVEPDVLMLFAPEQGGWHTGVFWEGAWRLHYDLETVLVPTHWLPAPPEVEIPTNTVTQLAWRLSLTAASGA